MATAIDTLYRPLAGWVQNRRIRIKIGLVPVLCLWVLVAGGVAAWVLLVKDPYGGEPIIQASLPVIAPPSASPTPAHEADEAAAPVAAGEDGSAAPAGEHSQVKIITPGGVSGQGQVRIIDVPNAPGSRVLRAAPEPRLVEKSRHGLLPRIAPDGTKPSAFYARPFDPAASNRSSAAPRIAVLFGGLGLSANLTSEAIAKLPAEVTLAFAPYGSALQAQVNKARSDGHEVMLHMPMEPFDFPANDPGPQTLLSTLTVDQNVDRLHWAMTRFSGFTGLANYMGAKFVTSEEGLKTLFTELKRRGLSFADDGSAARSRTREIARQTGIAFTRGALTIDAVPTQQRIDEALAALESEAEQKGFAMGVASALPISIERVARWAKAIERKGFVLVPVSVLTSATK